MRVFYKSYWTHLELVACAALVVSACGLGCATQSAPGPVAAVPEARSTPKRRASDMTALQDVGGVNERAVEESFESALDGLQGCVGVGVERVSILSGEITFALRLGEGGKLLSLWVRESDLGDRPTELCMARALEAVTWPPPIGGRTAEAQGSFAFELQSGETPPQVWDAGRAQRAGAKVSKTAQACWPKGERDSLVVTAYLDEEGSALAAGMASKHPVNHQIADCVVEAVLRDRYPPATPGSGPAKVRLRL